MATFVIVHGSFSGAWSWRRVATALQARGHEVFTPTLTGLGERAHLAGPEINLQTHIQDVVGVLEWEDLHEVILVGHSYGGAVVTGVTERAAKRIGRLVYADAMVLQDGESVADLLDPDLFEQVQAVVNEWGDGWQLPPPESPDTDPRDVPQPVQTFLQKLQVKKAEAMAIPRAYILCTAREDDPMLAAIEIGTTRAHQAGWPLYEIDAGHSLQREKPKEAAAVIAAAGLPGEEAQTDQPSK